MFHNPNTVLRTKGRAAGGRVPADSGAFTLFFLKGEGGELIHVGATAAMSDVRETVGAGGDRRGKISTLQQRN